MRNRSDVILVILCVSESIGLLYDTLLLPRYGSADIFTNRIVLIRLKVTRGDYGGGIVRLSGQRNPPVQRECLTVASWNDHGLQLRRRKHHIEPEHDVQGLSRLPGVGSMFLRHPRKRVQHRRADSAKHGVSDELHPHRARDLGQPHDGGLPPVRVAVLLLLRHGTYSSE